MAIVYDIFGGYYTPGKTPQLVEIINGKMALGWQPVGSPLLSNDSSWVSQAMIKVTAAPTKYTVITGYDGMAGNSTPFIKNNVPVDGWYPLGDPAWLSSHFYIQAWVNAAPYSPSVPGGLPLDLADPTEIAGVLPIAHGGTGNTAGAAVKLATARTIQTNLGSTTAASFDGTANVQPGVTGTLPITNGGTGQTTTAGFRTSFEVKYRKGATLTTEDLNTLQGLSDGQYFQNQNSNATLARNYPTTAAGVLDVIQNAANTTAGCTQLYWPYNEDVVYQRSYVAATATWSAWRGNWQFFRPLEVTANGNAVNLYTAATGNSQLIRGYDADRTSQLWYVGRSSGAANDIVLARLVDTAGVNTSALILQASTGNILLRANDGTNGNKDLTLTAAAGDLVTPVGGRVSIVADGDAVRIKQLTAGQQSTIRGLRSDDSVSWVVGNGVGTQNSISLQNVVSGSQILLLQTGEIRFLINGVPQSFEMSSAGLKLPSGLEVGNNSNNPNTTAGTSFVDFHSSGTTVDRDARISCTGGSSTVAQGTLNLEAIKVTGTIGGTTVAMASIPNTYTGKCTVDANGFVKAASPIVDLAGDGTSVVNDEAATVTTSRIGTGHYLLSGTLGLNPDPTWWMSVPHDVNGQALVWIDYLVQPSGDIEIFTYHRVHPESPEFARNIIEGVMNGDPIDIPSGKTVSLRVNVPI